MEFGGRSPTGSEAEVGGVGKGLGIESNVGAGMRCQCTCKNAGQRGVSGRKACFAMRDRDDLHAVPASRLDGWKGVHQRMVLMSRPTVTHMYRLRIP